MAAAISMIVAAGRAPIIPRRSAAFFVGPPVALSSHHTEDPMTDSIAQRDRHLNELILSGKALEGFEAYYADDVEMQENAEAPRKGKDLNREFERKFFDSIETFHGAHVVARAVGDDV